MQISEAFPSNYLKAADLQGRNALVTIARTEYEMIGNDKKLILYFQGKEKGMVLNKTNANNISQIYGDETDDWKGGEIILFEAMVDFQGKTVPAIRVKAAPRKPVQERPGTQPRMKPAGDPRGDMDDAIPF
jgi:arabinogalactan endo-1,4-beta-galactosidase